MHNSWTCFLSFLEKQTRIFCFLSLTTPWLLPENRKPTIFLTIFSPFCQRPECMCLKLFDEFWRLSTNETSTRTDSVAMVTIWYLDNVFSYKNLKFSCTKIKNIVAKICPIYPDLANIHVYVMTTHAISSIF